MFEDYKEKWVKIDCENGFYYKAKVINEKDGFLELIDFNSKRAFIKISTIQNIREIEL